MSTVLLSRKSHRIWNTSDNVSKAKDKNKRGLEQIELVIKWKILVPTHNCFTALPVDELTEIDSVPMTAINESHTTYIASTFATSATSKMGKETAWMICCCNNPGSKLLKLPISMQTTDTGTVLLMRGLLDGMTDLFVNSNFLQQNNLITKKLSQPIPVYNVDRTLNEAGSISEVWDAVLWYCNHTDCATFAIMGLG